MEKFIPYEKLSKRKKRELNAKQRREWGGMSPITRRAENPKAYNRKKTRKWSDDSGFRVFVSIIYLHSIFSIDCPWIPLPLQRGGLQNSNILFQIKTAYITSAASNKRQRSLPERSPAIL